MTKIESGRVATSLPAAPVVVKATVKPRFNPKVFRRIQRAGLPSGRFDV